ncbi:MAG: hypothetical protein FWD58_10110 [Firmicutes bacterium]|nr:hypothetical protein [Bacillota bacterium]
MENTTVTLISEPTPMSERVLKAAAYVRVSTESENQKHSLSGQYAYWEGRIKGDPKLERKVLNTHTAIIYKINRLEFYFQAEVPLSDYELFGKSLAIR